jgi:hypothetical protein
VSADAPDHDELIAKELSSTAETLHREMIAIADAVRILLVDGFLFFVVRDRRNNHLVSGCSFLQHVSKGRAALSDILVLLLIYLEIGAM